MARRMMTRAQWNFMDNTAERMMRAVMPKASARSAEPINGWAAKKIVEVQPLMATLAELSQKEKK
jgi:hypothetical protein